MALDTGGETEGILDGSFHGGNAQLCLDAAVDILHHGVNDRLGMNKHLNTFGGDVEEPAGFDDLEAFVHEGGRVDGDFASHAPVGVFEGIGKSDVLQLLACAATERSARSGEEYLVHVAHLAHETLENGRVFGVDRQDGDVVAGGGIGDYLPGYHHGLLIGQRNRLVVLDSAKSGTEAGKTHNGCQYHVDGVHLHEVGNGVHACKDLDVVRG